MMSAHGKDSASTAVIIINWKRPQNIGRIVRTAHEALPDAEIFIIENAAEPNRLAGRDDVPFDLCNIRVLPDAGPGGRFVLAAELPFEHYLCIDDDIFLTVDQVRGLVAKLAAEPKKAHGVKGQLVIVHDDGNSLLRFGITGDVTTINQVYAFTRERAHATMSFAAELGYQRCKDMSRTDDIVFSSAGPACCHDLGPIDACPTNNRPGIALRRTGGFRVERKRLRLRLRERGLLYVERSSEPFDFTNVVRTRD